MTEDKKNVKERKLKSALMIGAVGGAFWTLVGYAAYFMNFSKLGPSLFAKPFISQESLDQPFAHFMGIGVAIVFSILVSLAYVFTLAHFYSPLIGVALGGGVFLLFFYGLSPLLGLTKQPIHLIGMNTFATELCLFILWGLFIGFSLSTEFSSRDNAVR
ncbi:YqhR family membrane protein [Ammoniphilus sp. YIM 78166]|uniref:YqhR family membrane protein n=1 Tax=Ammoniphilus sp. YIM 78166 TaxID=1644106 RepID=UPI00106FCE9A|nr:YqhR family membrane protein [Ammoniphilus sp. YIM 78166]